MATEVPQPTLAVQGGSDQQRSVVTQAHASALTLAQQGRAKAQAGQGPFAAWFGAATAAAQATVAAAFGQAAALLQTRWVLYELDTATLDRPAYPGIYVLFEPRSDTNADAYLVSTFWDAYAVDPATAAAALAASVLHEALTVSSGGQVADLLGATDEGSAQALATAEPAAALTSARNFMGYAGAVVGGVGAADGGDSAVAAVAGDAPPNTVDAYALARSAWLAAGIPHAHVAATPDRARIVRFGADGVAVAGTVVCDFARVARGADGAIAGGSFALVAKAPDGSRGETVVTLRPGGRPQTARTIRYAGGGSKVTSIVDTDYRGLAFGPGGPVTGGTLASVKRSPSGRARSATAQRFDALGNLASTQTVRYGAAGQVTARTLTDFRGATFGPDHRVERGVVATTVRRADGSVRSRTATLFARGAVALTSVRRYAADGTTLQRQLVVLAPRSPGGSSTAVRIDCTRATLGPGRTLRTGRVATRVSGGGRPLLDVLLTRRADGLLRTAKALGPDGRTVLSETIDELRADGTLAARLTGRLGAGERLTSIEALAYAADGRTVLNHAVSDYTDAQLSPTNRVLGGTVSVESMRSDGSRKARADLSFENSE